VVIDKSQAFLAAAIEGQSAAASALHLLLEAHGRAVRPFFSYPFFFPSTLFLTARESQPLIFSMLPAKPPRTCVASRKLCNASSESEVLKFGWQAKAMDPSTNWREFMAQSDVSPVARGSAETDWRRWSGNLTALALEQEARGDAMSAGTTVLETLYVLLFP